MWSCTLYRRLYNKFNPSIYCTWNYKLYKDDFKNVSLSNLQMYVSVLTCLALQFSIVIRLWRRLYSLHGTHVERVGFTGPLQNCLVYTNRLISLYSWVQENVHVPVFFWKNTQFFPAENLSQIGLPVVYIVCLSLERSVGHVGFVTKHAKSPFLLLSPPGMEKNYTFHAKVIILHYLLKSARLSCNIKAESGNSIH